MVGERVPWSQVDGLNFVICNIGSILHCAWISGRHLRKENVGSWFSTEHPQLGLQHHSLQEALHAKLVLLLLALSHQVQPLAQVNAAPGELQLALSILCEKSPRTA